MFGRGLFLDDGFDIVDKAFQADRGFLQIKFAGFNLGEVEYGVDGVEKVLAGGLQLVEPLGLLGGQTCPPDQVCHAVDGVERCSDFVRHIGEEGTLGDVGRFCGSLGFLELLGALFNQPFQVVVVLIKLFFCAFTVGDVFCHDDDLIATHGVDQE